MSVREGDRFRDPEFDETFTVADAPDAFGLSTAEKDRLSVAIEFDDGEILTVPHERFRGRTTYERVSDDE